MKGVNDEEDLCLDMELFSDWDWKIFDIKKETRVLNRKAALKA